MIRLFAIDAPEMRQSCADALGARYACGDAAGTALRVHVNATLAKFCHPRKTVPNIRAASFGSEQSAFRWRQAAPRVAIRRVGVLQFHEPLRLQRRRGRVVEVHVSARVTLVLMEKE